jgi:ABC-type iron transport system FetAB ATPase subunit
MLTKREREIQEKIEALNEERDLYENKIMDLDLMLKDEEKQLAWLKKQKQYPKAIPLEDLIKGGWNDEKKKEVEEMIRKLWRNEDDEEHITVNGDNLYGLVDKLIKGVNNSNAVVVLMIPELKFKWWNLNSDVDMNIVSYMQDHPRSIRVYSK